MDMHYEHRIEVMYGKINGSSGSKLQINVVCELHICMFLLPRLELNVMHHRLRIDYYIASIFITINSVSKDYKHGNLNVYFSSVFNN